MIRFTNKSLILSFATTLFILSMGFHIPTVSADVIKEKRAETPPPSLETLQEIEGTNIIEKIKEPEKDKLQLRINALQEAAFSYGARGGLAWRTYFIRKELVTKNDYLDRIYSFRQLLIPAPSGFLIEPPIVSEALNAQIIEKGGLQAAVTDRVYNISKNAKIVSAARDWRVYLERDWGTVEPPPEILRPASKEERKQWRIWVAKGWEEGLKQADDIFEQDLNRLTADYLGMVRYRKMLAQNMVSLPYALQTDRGVTGGGNELKIGDRAVEITGLPSLTSGYNQWRPASR
jgi:defect-in-organelle-trafficking protein DotC